MRLLVAIAAVVACWSPISVAQSTWNQGLGRHVAHDLLMRLTNPRNTDYRVGVINTAAEVGVLVSPKGEPPVAESIRGYSTSRGSGWRLSWTATELLDSSADDLLFETSMSLWTMLAVYCLARLVGAQATCPAQ
jgi:hypothetical protein